MTGPSDRPFGPLSTADDVIAGVDLGGRRARVTGASGGLGRETARALASAGAEVTIAARDPDRAALTAKQVADETGNPDVLAARLDLADLASVRSPASSS